MLTKNICGSKLGNLQAVREGFANGGDPKHYGLFGYDSLKIAEKKNMIALPSTLGMVAVNGIGRTLPAKRS